MQSTQPPGPAAAHTYDKMAYQVIYPQYIDALLTPGEGRRLTKEQSVENPSLNEMEAAIRQLGYTSVIVDHTKSLPRSQCCKKFVFVPRGCLRVAIKHPAGDHHIKTSKYDECTRGAVVDGIKNKNQLLRRVAAILKANGVPRPHKPTVVEAINSLTAVPGAKSRK